MAVRTVLVGHGFLGKFHGQKMAVHPGQELVAIVEANQTAHGELRELYPQVQIVSTLEQALELGEAFVVATPSGAHFEVCRTLLKNHKHVFCEKPLCAEFHEIESLKGIPLLENQVLQVGHSERFHGIFALERFKEVLSLFKPVRASAQRYAPRSTRALDVDVVVDLFIHDMDLYYFLGGEIPKKVYAKGVEVFSGTYDVVTLMTEGEHGQWFNLELGRAHSQARRFWRLFGESGTLEIDLMNESALWIKTNGEQELIKADKQDHLKVEQDHFIASITKQSQPVVGIHDAWKVALVESAIKRSLQTGLAQEVGQ